MTPVVKVKCTDDMQDITTSELCKGQSLIVFDGHCVLCSGFFRFVLKHDRQQKFRFATAQSKLGQGLYRDLDLPVDDFETNLVIIDGTVYQRLDAFAAAMRHLSGPWRCVSLCRFLPAVLKDAVYHVIARNRFAFFGRADVCMVPDRALRAWFAPDGY